MPSMIMLMCLCQRDRSPPPRANTRDVLAPLSGCRIPEYTRYVRESPAAEIAGRAMQSMVRRGAIPANPTGHGKQRPHDPPQPIIARPQCTATSIPRYSGMPLIDNSKPPGYLFASYGAYTYSRCQLCQFSWISPLTVFAISLCMLSLSLAAGLRFLSRAPPCQGARHLARSGAARCSLAISKVHSSVTSSFCPSNPHYLFSLPRLLPSSLLVATITKVCTSRTVTPWHHDQPYYPVDGDQAVSIWMPLDHVPRDTCVQFVQGSHLGNRWYFPRKFSSSQNYQVGVFWLITYLHRFVGVPLVSY